MTMEVLEGRGGWGWNGGVLVMNGVIDWVGPLLFFLADNAIVLLLVCGGFFVVLMEVGRRGVRPRRLLCDRPAF